MPGKDFYKILGVDQSAGEGEIKKAYRKLAKQYHPDINPGNKGAEDKFKEITEAYAVLSDPQKRKQYDAVGPDGFDSGFDFSQFFGGGFRPRSGQRVYHFSGRGGDFNLDMGGLEDIFGSLFGGGGGFQGFPQQERVPQAETYQLEVDFLTAVRGGEVEVSIDGGRKRIRVPAGIESGQTIRLAGKGKRKGDTLLAITVKPHRQFRREGDDIEMDAPVTIPEAVLGGTIEVPTIDGTSKVELPAGTSSGRKLRLRGKGVYRRDGGRGDQYVRIQVAVPKKLDSRSKELIEEFQKLNPGRPDSVVE
ncbi:MAG: DnaJ C-terminal domain-containing protein [Pseudomonadota bacterium]